MHDVILNQSFKKALVILVLLGQALSLTGFSLAVQVCKVHDSDTLTTCQGQRVRLAGIDAPELKQRYGYSARDTLKSMALGQDVSLTCDGKSYNRKVCQVFLGTRNVNEAMVQQGFAYDYAHYSHGAYLPAQQYA